MKPASPYRLTARAVPSPARRRLSLGARALAERSGWPSVRAGWVEALDGLVHDGARG